ncbi:MAG: 3-hydroxyacyl-CoA dehydrogenase family protein [Pyrinomonadaceae bacterium]|nr:3-hydroxyacyl-CoA dehydrogenase family protein [Pyrinomonadaceae bacterium]
MTTSLCNVFLVISFYLRLLRAVRRAFAWRQSHAFGCSLFLSVYSITLRIEPSRIRARQGNRWAATDFPLPKVSAKIPLSLSQQSDHQTRRVEIETIAVLGAGTMGHGIAQVAAACGYRVILRDTERAALARGVQAIEKNLAKGMQLAKVTEAERDLTLQHIRGAVNLAETRDADLFIEAAPERLELKRAVLREVEAVAVRPFIFATNTSALSITEIARDAARPAHVVGMHFFNPVHLMRLVEIVTGAQTSAETVEAVRAVAGRMRKEPITVRDVPGFASSRLGVALGLEAMRMLEQEVASARDIDTAMELGYNHPLGPLRLTDLVGLDIRLHIAEYLHRALGSETFRPPEILRRMVEEGKLGRKSGEGFYLWDD